MEKNGSCSNNQSNNKYICNRCKKTFPLYCMYACYHGHYMCKLCHQKVNSGNSYYTSQTDLETVDDKLDLAQTTSFLGQDTDINSGSIHRTRLMFPNPSAYQQNTLDNHNSLISLATVCRPSLLSFGASKKPIFCPQYDCRKTVAVSSLDAHFHHEHKQVATIVTQLETRNCLEFNFKDLRGKQKNMCLVLITLEPDGYTNITSEYEISMQKNTGSKLSRQSQNQQKPFFILIAAKMPFGNSEDKEDQLDYEYKSHERVFFYVTSNVIGNFSYTIAVSTPVHIARIKYFGPLLSVNEDCRKLCKEGKGLVLNHYDINGMSNNGCTPVNLDLILHERDDQSLGECI